MATEVSHLRVVVGEAGPEETEVDKKEGIFAPTFWEAGEETDYAAWSAVGETLKARRTKQDEELSSTLWQVADWLNWGEGTFPDRYSQALDATDYTKAGLDNAARCGRAFPRGRRHHPENLSFWLHDEFTGVPEADRWVMADEAAGAGWGRSQIRARLAEYREANAPGQDQLPGTEGDGADEHGSYETCPLCEGAARVHKDRAEAYRREEGGGY